MLIAAKAAGQITTQHHRAKNVVEADDNVVRRCWAIYRKWHSNDLRSYDLIRPAIRKEFDIFARGTKFYY